jgi:sodium transport system permease protein
MKFNKILTIYKKEIKDTLRDRRTLMVMVLVPIVLYPVLFSVMGQIMSIGSQKLESEISAIAYIHEIPHELDSLLQKEDNLEIAVSSNPASDLKNGNIQAYLEIKHFSITDSLFIYYDGALDRSRLARERLENVVQIYKRSIQEYRLQEAGIDLSVLNPFGVRKVNTAPPARMGGMILGSIIPLLLIVTLMLGAMYPAIDLTAGEKERGTLETILTAPVQRLELLMGKFFTVSTIAFITGFLNLFSMTLAYSIGFIQLGVLSGKLEFTFSPIALLILFLLIIPLSLFISAIMLSVSLFARSFKDAQNLITPLYLILILPAFFAMTPGIELTNFLALIPILNVTLLFKEIMLQNFSIELIFAVFLSNSVFAFFTILIFSKLFNTEQILFAEGKGLQFSLKRSEIKQAEVFQPANTLLILMFILLLLFYIGSIIQLRFGHWGILGIEWGLIFLPVILAIWYNKVNFKKSLNLKSFNSIALLGSIMLIFGGLILTAFIAQIQIKFFPETVKISEAMEQILNLKITGLHPVLGIFLFAISPGICEELLFRGILLSSLKERFSPAYTIIIVAILFGIFHMHIFRILPTAVIGLYLTFIVYKTGSVYLSIIGHSLNNALALMIISYPEFREHFGWLTGEEPISLFIIIVMILLISSGVFFILYSSRTYKYVRV